MCVFQLPWSDYSEPWAIIDQLSKGERPFIPAMTLSKEGHAFLNKCLNVNEDSRPTAIELASDPFVKVILSI